MVKLISIVGPGFLSCSSLAVLGMVKLLQERIAMEACCSSLAVLGMVKHRHLLSAYILSCSSLVVLGMVKRPRECRSA